MQTIVGLAILLTSLAGIVTSIALLWVKVIKPLFRFCKRIGQVVDVVQDLPEWQKDVDKNLKELKPNGGGSLKDEVSQIKAMMEVHLKDHV